MAEIAFFGLGTMGVPMAINLLKAGHHLHVLPHNGHMDGPLAVQKYGACIHETLQETVGDAEFVISVVPDDAAVRDLYLESGHARGHQARDHHHRDDVLLARDRP